MEIKTKNDMTMRILLLSGILVLTLMGCKSENKNVQAQDTNQEVATVVPEAVMNKKPQVGSQVPAELVCMVNDAYMGKIQMPVPVKGKTYYGCCQMCVKTLNNNHEARTGIDPFSNQKIDKTEAYIVLMKEEGAVAYFESKENYLSYSKKQ
jgi:YHS domain-containing protein|tara:strand:- start:2622 stop:3074 length:453 start_codon:yes stop_codon:yes gene_type:complete